MNTSWARTEMEGARVFDRRRITSLTTLCEKLEVHAGQSFSAACGPAARQAAHRIFKHPRIRPVDLLHGHYQETARRCAALPLVLVAQDTSEFDYGSHPATTGLGPTNDSPRGWGLFGHAALALTPAGEPLGLLHLDLWARDPQSRGKKHQRQHKRTDEKESRKWGDGHAAVEAAVPEGPAVLLIQDRESDVFAFLARPRRPGLEFLVRAYHPRSVTVPPTADAPATPNPGKAGKTGKQPATRRLQEVAAEAPVVAELTVTVAARPGQKERQARLWVRLARVRVQRPAHLAREVAVTEQELWVLRATEQDPPPGVRRVDWVLLTTGPVPDGERAGQLVQYYARRWGIERLHYTLKTGLRVERLQIDDFASLRNALALHYVVAWRLLQITHQARTTPEAAPDLVLTPTEHTVLEHALHRPLRTLREAVRAIAKLGGWEDYPAAGEPGVLSLWRGLSRLAALTEGWKLAHQSLCLGSQKL